MTGDQWCVRNGNLLHCEEELASELPATDFPLYLGVAYFRLEGN